MKKTGLHNVPKAPAGFHHQVLQTLENLPERKEGILMKKKFTKILVAAAVIAALGVTAFAGGRLMEITGHSSRADDFYELPTPTEAAEIVGAEPVLLESFSNGYTFQRGNTSENTLIFEGNSKGKEYQSMELGYAKDGDEVFLSFGSPVEPGDYVDDETESIDVDGRTLYYARQTYKIVPPDYQMTEQDKQDEADGTYVFSYGSETVEVKDFQHLSWSQGELNYELYAHDSVLARGDLVAMAEEILAAE